MPLHWLQLRETAPQRHPGRSKSVGVSKTEKGCNEPPCRLKTMPAQKPSARWLQGSKSSSARRDIRWWMKSPAHLAELITQVGEKIPFPSKWLRIFGAISWVSLRCAAQWHNDARRPGTPPLGTTNVLGGFSRRRDELSQPGRYQRKKKPERW